MTSTLYSITDHGDFWLEYCTNQLVVPTYRLNSCGLRAFSVRSLRLWDSLPRVLRDTGHNNPLRDFGNYAPYKSTFYLLTNQQIGMLHHICRPFQVKLVQSSVSADKTQKRRPQNNHTDLPSSHLPSLMLKLSTFFSVELDCTEQAELDASDDDEPWWASTWSLLPPCEAPAPTDHTHTQHPVWAQMHRTYQDANFDETNWSIASYCANKSGTMTNRRTIKRRTQTETFDTKAFASTATQAGKFIHMLWHKPDYSTE